MKKIILAAALAFGSLLNAQITVNIPGGTLHDGDTYTTTSIAPVAQSAENKLRFVVVNNSEESLNVGVRVNSISDNTDGTNLQLCYNICVYSITEGQIVPDTPSFFPLDPGASSEGDNHFVNVNPGTGGNVVYNLSFVTVDDNNAVLTTPITFTYIYAPDAGLTDLNGLKQMGFNVSNTVVSSTLNIDATQTAKLQVFDINGKLVKAAAIVAGAQATDLSSLSTGVYFARFTTEQNKMAQIKIVKN
jgi:Secretion system C-terminal sorting domain